MVYPFMELYHIYTHTHNCPYMPIHVPVLYSLGTRSLTGVLVPLQSVILTIYEYDHKVSNHLVLVL